MPGPAKLPPFEAHKWEEGKLGEALQWVILHECEGAREVTLRADYNVRARWLVRVFGDCPLADLCGSKGYHAMKAAHETHRLREIDDDDHTDDSPANDNGTGEKESRRIANATIKKRFKFLIRAMKLAAARDLIRRDQIPIIPKIRGDETPQTDFWTLAEYEAVRSHLEAPWQRMAVDVGFWTGMHRLDVWQTEWWHLDVDRPFRDEHGKVAGRGMFFFRNTKTNKHVPNWQTMHPRFRECVIEFAKAVGKHDPDQLVVGVFFKPTIWLYPACDAAGVKRIRWKNLRQCRFKFLEERGVQFGDLRYLMGHIGISTAITTRHYLGTVASPGTLVRIHSLLTDEKKPPRSVGGGRQGPRKKNRDGM